jgi:hypothetical protein
VGGSNITEMKPLIRAVGIRSHRLQRSIFSARFCSSMNPMPSARVLLLQSASTPGFETPYKAVLLSGGQVYCGGLEAMGSSWASTGRSRSRVRLVWKCSCS